MDYQPVELAYEEHGEGIPVIFLHGFPFDRSIWQPLISKLEPAARLILPDLRGFGQSPAPEGVYSMRTMAEDVVHLMDRLSLSKAVLVGHSMGGYISLAFAQAYPGRLAGLGLVATHAAADTPERRQMRRKQAASVKRRGVKVVAANMAPKITTHPDLVLSLSDLMLRASRNAVIGCLQGMADRQDLTGELSAINVPAVVLAGTADQLLQPENVNTTAQMLPKGWLVEIPDCGHMLMLEEPDLVAGPLMELIRMA